MPAEDNTAEHGWQELKSDSERQTGPQHGLWLLADKIQKFVPFDPFSIFDSIEACIEASAKDLLVE